MKRVTIVVVGLLTFFSFLQAQKSIPATASRAIDETSQLCAKPVGIYVSELSQRSAKINWGLADEGYRSTVFRLEVTAADGSIVVNEPHFVSLNYSYQIKNLSPNTKYSVRIQSDCSDAAKGESEMSATYSFKTLQNASSLPLVENFDALYDLPAGWVINEENFGGVRVQSSVKYGSSGKSLKLKSTSQYDAYIVISPMASPANDMEFRAMVCGDANAGFTIGLATNPLDPSTFEVLYSGTTSGVGKWEEVRFYSADSYYQSMTNTSFVISVSKDRESVVYVDDVNITKMPSCLRPDDLKFSSVDSSSVSLSWSHSGAMLAYQVRLVAGSDTTWHKCGSTTTKISNLLVNSHYNDVRVRAICAVGDTSDWSPVVEFSTSCGAAESTTFLQGFESEGDIACWTSRQIVAPDFSGGGEDYGDGAWSRYPASYSSTYVHSGKYSMRHADSKKGIRTLLVAQPIFVDRAAKYDVSFWVYRKNDEYASTNEGVAFWVGNRPELTGATKLDFIHNSCQNSPVISPAVSGWYKYEYNIPLSGSVYLMFEGVAQGGVSTYIDDVQVALAPSCRPVVDVSFGSSTTTTQSLSWRSKGSERQWQISYRATTDGHVVSDTLLVNTPNFDIPNLLPASSYYISGSVVAVCGSDDMSAPTLFSKQIYTKDLPVVDFPYHENFDGAIFPPLSWIQFQSLAGSGNGTNYGDVVWVRNSDNDYTAQGSAASAKMQKSQAGTHACLVSRQLNFSPDKLYRLKLWFYRNNSHRHDEGIKVWVSSTPNLTGASELIFLRSNRVDSPTESETGMYNYVVDIPKENSSLQYIIFEGVSQYSLDIIIDNIIVEERPQCADLSEFTIDSISHNRAVVKVSDQSAQQWQVEYGLRGFALGNGTMALGSGEFVAIESLLPNSDYDIYIRRVCGAEYGEWSLQPQRFTTMCAPFVVDSNTPYFEGFENFANGDRVLGCYSLLYATYTSDFVVSNHFSGYGWSSEINPFEGNLCAMKSSTSNTWAFARLYLQAGVNYEVSAQFMQDKTEGATASFACVKSLDFKSVNASHLILSKKEIVNKWELAQGFFSVVESGVYYVGWNIEQSSTPSRTAIDNFQVRELPCVPPSNLMVSEISTNSAVVSFRSPSHQTEVLVGTLFHDTINSNFVRVDGLSSATEYEVKVRDICGEGEDGSESDWVTSSFRTACSAKGLPYKEDFEVKSDFLCWNVLGNGEANVSVRYQHGGAKSLELNSVSVVSPRIDVASLGGYMLSGWCYSTREEATFYVGAVDKSNDMEYHQDVQTIVLPSRNQWHEFIVFFDNLDDSGEFVDPKYFTLRVGDEATIYFDDVVLGNPPTCLSPLNVEVSDITDNSAQLSWTPQSDETQWNVVVMNGSIEVQNIVVAKSNITLRNLVAGTTYTANVRAKCGAAEFSRWSKSSPFSTLCAVKSIPFEDDFDAIVAQELSPCWQNIDASPQGVFNFWEGNYNEIKYRGDMNPNGYSATVASPVFDLTNEEGAVLSLDIKNVDTDLLDILLSIDGGLTYTISLEESDFSDTYVRYKYDLTPYVGNQIRVALKATSRGIWMSNLFVDNFKIERRESCPPPSMVQCVASTSTTADIKISDIDSHQSWQYVYGLEDFNPQSATPLDAAQPTFTIDNLQSHTKYQIYVRTNCGALQGSWSAPISFVTACAEELPLPYEENFESVDVISDLCLSFVNWKSANSSYPYAKIDNAAADVLGEQSLKIYSSNKEDLYVVLPKTNRVMSRQQLRFDYRKESTSNANGTIAVGLMLDNGDASSFHLIKEYPRNDKYSSVVVDFNDIPMGYENSYVTLKCGGGSSNGFYIWVDNIELRLSPSCAEIATPQLLSISESEANVKVNSMADKVELRWDEESISVNDCANIITLVDDRSFTLKDLKSAHSYVVYARAICSPDTSDWSTALRFTTNCGALPLAMGERYIENFDSYNEAQLLPSCFTTLKNSVVGSVTYPSMTTSPVQGGAKALTLGVNNIIALPEFEVGANELKLSFDVSGGGVLYVGMQNLLDINSPFIQVATVPVYAAQHCSFNLSELGVKGKYVVLKSSQYTQKLYIDNLVVERVAVCYAPENTMVESLTATSATLQWVADDGINDFECQLVKGDEVIPYIVSINKIELTDLEPSTEYQFRVRSHCGEELYSNWSEVSFTTEAIPVVSCSIESVDIVGVASDAVAFRTVAEGATQAKYTLYKVGDTTPIIEDVISFVAASCEGALDTTVVVKNLSASTAYQLIVENLCKEQKAVPQRFLCDVVTLCEPLVVDAEHPFSEGFEQMPNNAPISECWQNRPIKPTINRWYSYFTPREHSLIANSGIGYAALQYSSNCDLSRNFYLQGGVSYQFSFYLKKADSDGFQLSIFSSRDGVVTTHRSIAVENAEYQLVRQRIDIATTGEYNIGINAQSDGRAWYVAVDDMSLVQLSPAAPSSFVIDEIDAVSASCSWSGEAEKYQMRVDASGVILLDTLFEDGETSYKLEGLNPATHYNVALRGIITASNDTSMWYDEEFTTLCGVIVAPMVENFENIEFGELPNCWEHHASSVEAHRWGVVSKSANKYLELTPSKEGDNALFSISPVIIPKGNCKVSFDVINSTLTKLQLLVSNDGGSTFIDTAMVDFNPEWSTYIYNVSDYSGDTLTLYYKSTAKSGAIGIDNLRIGKLGAEQLLRDTVCAGSPYEENGFNIPARELEEGDWQFTRLATATINGENDHIVKLQLHVSPSGIFHINDSICRGDIYSKGAFADKNISTAGDYMVSLVSSSGCDSTVFLHLSVIDIFVYINDTICEGESYMFDGVARTTTGVYVQHGTNHNGCDSTTTLNLFVQPAHYEINKLLCEGDEFQWCDTTLKTTGRYLRSYTSQRGCDSIVVMNLTVLPDTTFITANVCRGNSYFFANKDRFEAGVYSITYANVLKCDSVVQLTLTVTEPDTIEISDWACENQEYYDNGFSDVVITKDSVLVRTNKTAEGCDYITRLSLRFEKTDTVYEAVTIAEGETYDFAGNTLTISGEYEGKFQNDMGCDSIVILTLTVGTGVDNLYALPIVVAPNPIEGGAATYISRTWSAAEQDGMTLEVVNSLGQVVLRSEPTTYPIAVDGITVSGIYYIRITAGTGERYVGKLIVK